MPKYEREDIIIKTKMALNILKNKELLYKYKFESLITIKKHSIKNEQSAFYKILNIPFSQES